MNLSIIEKEIYFIIKNLKEASITQIKRESGASIFTIKKICKLLVNQGYLMYVGGQKYRSTEKQLDYSINNLKKINDDIVNNIATQVAEQISKKIGGKISFGGQESGIKIKTDFTPHIEDETATLDTNIGKSDVKLEKEKAQKIEESVKLLKNFKTHNKR